MFYKILLLFYLYIFYPISVFCQFHANDSASLFSKPILLDSFVKKSNFDIEAFIKRLQSDTTFYKAFKSMRLVPYTATNSITVYNKKNDTIAALHSKSQQKVFGNCRKTIILNQKTIGNILNNNNTYNYYTATLYSHLFFALKPICGQTDRIAGIEENEGSNTIEKSEYQLKQLIFNPGSKIKGIPLIGNKASIFDEDEKYKYLFKILEDTLNGENCYVFYILPKEKYKNRVVYNELTTWFRKRDFAIVARNYSLSFKTLFYEFDVKMNVLTTKYGEKLYPTVICYNGNWHVFTKKREIVQFRMDIDYGLEKDK